MAKRLHFLPETMPAEARVEKVKHARTPPSSVLARMIVLGFILGGGLGVYFGMGSGWIVGITTTWLSGNIFALILAFGWYRLTTRREQAAAGEDGQESHTDPQRHRDAA